MSSTAFQTTIHARAMTQIMDVALKYSPERRYKSAYPGKTPINHKRNDSINTHQSENDPN